MKGLVGCLGMILLFVILLGACGNMFSSSNNGLCDDPSNDYVSTQKWDDLCHDNK